MYTYYIALSCQKGGKLCLTSRRVLANHVETCRKDSCYAALLCWAELGRAGPGGALPRRAALSLAALALAALHRAVLPCAALSCAGLRRAALSWVRSCHSS